MRVAIRQKSGLALVHGIETSGRNDIRQTGTDISATPNGSKCLRFSVTTVNSWAFAVPAMSASAIPGLCPAATASASSLPEIAETAVSIGRIRSSYDEHRPSIHCLRRLALADAPLRSSNMIPRSISWTVTTDRKNSDVLSIWSSQAIKSVTSLAREGDSRETTFVSRRYAVKDQHPATVRYCAQTLRQEMSSGK